MKFSSVHYLVKKGIDNVVRNKMMAFASFCVLLVSLLLVGVSVLAYLNVNSIIGGVEQKNEIAIYLQDGIPNEMIEHFGDNLRGLPNVADVVFYSKEEALDDFKARMADSDMLFDSLNGENPLPDAYRVRVADIQHISETVSTIAKFEGVDSIDAPYDFVNSLLQIRKVLMAVMGTLILAMVIVSIVIISSTTKTSVYSRREEIQIMKYVGATDAFIRFPFFVEGMVTGFFAGCIAFLVTWGVYTAVTNALQNQTLVLNIIGTGSIIQFTDIILPIAISYMAVGALIGALGCAISTKRYINV
ncbi:MAG TPA: ABC transporter permease [Ruminococcus sp.]|nr:ABC transporter permease [Ruminococcus sp.]